VGLLRAICGDELQLLSCLPVCASAAAVPTKNSHVGSHNHSHNAPVQLGGMTQLALMWHGKMEAWAALPLRKWGLW